MYKIIYKNQDGSISIIEPLPLLDIDLIAKKDVPYGVPYKIVSSSDIPTDRTFRNAWTANFESYDGIGEGINYDNN